MDTQRPSKTEIVPVPRVADEVEVTLASILGTGTAEATSLTTPIVDWNLSRLPITENRYSIQSPLPHGGMGDLYVAMDKLLGRQVAIKVLKADQVGDQVTADRFLQEARIHSQFHHYGIPPLHDVGRLPDGRPYIAMKYIDGQNLTYLLDMRSSLVAEVDEFIRIFDHVCQTVAYAHAKGVIHRDLTTNNVLVSTQGRVSVIDWGLSKVIGQPRTPSKKGTQSDTTGTAPLEVPNLCDTAQGVALGTPAFIPPEQAAGASRNASMRSDVFGLGGILCYILTGRPPYTGNPLSVMMQAKNGDARQAFERLDACGCSAELIDLAKRCLSRSAEHRPANASVVAQEIESYRTRQKAARRSWWAKLFYRPPEAG